MLAAFRGGASLCRESRYQQRICRQPPCLFLPPAARPRRGTFSSGFTSSHEPAQDLRRGPIFDRSAFGVPHFYPRDLKKRVDDYVVGQDRAKKTICSVIFNHYQGLRRRQAQEDAERCLRERLRRKKYWQDREWQEQARQNVQPLEGGRQLSDAVDHVFKPSPWGYRADGMPPEDEFPEQDESFGGAKPLPDEGDERMGDFYRAEDGTNAQHVTIDKSNLLLLGPTGVGKTYILETLSRKLNVPFTINDCNSFTQAGYIGQDVETCIERLLAEANYDVRATEHGIVVLDEFDKLARRDTNNGRDVGGEGVQQALLKLVEGTKITVNVKENRSSRPAGTTGGGFASGGSAALPPCGKVDQYTIDTTNILFVFCGAFVGLDKGVLRRVARPSIGFGSEIRGGRNPSGGQDMLPATMYAHLPHQPVLDAESWHRNGAFSPLDLTTPEDLQAFGFIPELIGRMHNICALTPLSLDKLYRILTEPRNSLVAQYTALFETYPSKLYFTRPALYAIAERAAKNETGARGLKMEMERVLAEAMFDAPMPYVLITESSVNGSGKAAYWGKDGRLELERRLRDEDEKGSRFGFGPKG